MPFDGIVTKCVVSELSEIITSGRLEKIFQPEPDEIIIHLRSKGKNMKLLLSAGVSYPRIHITEASPENPAIAPAFCMLLRKHILGGKITGVTFNDFERVIGIDIEAMDEFGDILPKKLIIEIMGKHSNIILINDTGKILDSIKHVDSSVSSLREVMPGGIYLPPPQQAKLSPESLDVEAFLTNSKNAPEVILKNHLLSGIKGFSPLVCREICLRAEVDENTLTSDLSQDAISRLINTLSNIISDIENCLFKPCLLSVEGGGNAVDFHCMEITSYPYKKYSDSISSVLDTYYSEKDNSERLRQKKSSLVKTLGSLMDRSRKKISIQEEKLREVSDREKLQLSGELLTANIYCIPKNAKSVSLLNYYSESGENVDIRLDENLSPQDNAQRYFKKYRKAKSAFIHTEKQLEDSRQELLYLESVLQMLENSKSVHEIDEIRQELFEQGYVASIKKGSKAKNQKPSEPLRFKSSDGFQILVGKNNRQNDQLTMKLASSNDMWLHTRNIPGSHVIIKKGQTEIPDSTIFEAAMLAAYHSKAGSSTLVPVDYTTVRNVKKPAGAKPGMVIYDNFKTVTVTPDETRIKELSNL